VKGRDSGMPEEAYRESFYDADCVVEQLECPSGYTDRVVEFGCGYGTFTLPVARRTSGPVFAFDIEPELDRLGPRSRKGSRRTQHPAGVA